MSTVEPAGGEASRPCLRCGGEAIGPGWDECARCKGTGNEPAPTAKASSPTLWIDCEGSECPPTGCHAFNGGTVGMCAMCGKFVTLVGARIGQHDRQDVLAMIARGDFG